ncbi:hypothetical protein PUNSTDRAFT_52758 [Punctularia strigosozonata HHB-11173 SS5]|uniref:uncharacterized protein n=1 Tax=Punctularia strigosozonata (strain HHB-11173) TaxID=741275 RepID=UPI0004416983|nr:uncharacterized protein PUNSTDRAFT_52758 [Punctularia strigosozonata HHB-11173 SS5]EIN08328.1 hypothetical protein PUNSTDRAFT_52758 [Punctularia strigosozonata HHB-11173 SS5]
MMLSCVALSLAVLGLSALVKAVSPPDEVTLLRPQSAVTVNTTACYGFAEPVDEPHFSGLWRTMNITLFAPNGTNIGSVGIGTDGNDTDVPLECGTFPGTSYAGCAVVPDEGTYTIVWNITYRISASKTNCTAPFSTQNFLLNATFDASAVYGGEQATGFTDPVVSSTATLPTKPTGSIKKSAGSAVVVSWKTVVSPLLVMAIAMFAL